MLFLYGFVIGITVGVVATVFILTTLIIGSHHGPEPGERKPQ